jgi:BRCT domain type II-containing protein
MEQGLEHHTPSCTIRLGQHDKTSPVKEDSLRKALLGQRFVLSRTWPRLGGGQWLTLGNEAVKVIIEKYGGSVTSEFLRLTNALVIGENPGPKKVLNAHGCN